MQNKDYSSILLFVIRSFRDTADKDYINARICYFCKLDNQFFWSSLQALEKYLKSILLFSGINTKDLSHDIVKSLNRLQEINDLAFDFINDKRLTDFIQYILLQGNNRYNDKSRYLKPYTLFELDRSVWMIRRYCQQIRKFCRGKNDISKFPINQTTLDNIEVDSSKNPHQFSISGGYLEIIINSKDSLARKYLVLKNPYFGKNRKKTIKKYPNRISSSKPEYYFNPNVFKYLEKIVYFNKNLKNEVNNAIS